MKNVQPSAMKNQQIRTTARTKNVVSCRRNIFNIFAFFLQPATHMFGWVHFYFLVFVALIWDFNFVLGAYAQIDIV